MEGDERQRRQYDQANYPSARGFGQPPRGVPSSSSSSGSNVPDRFGQSQLLATRPEMSAPPAVPGPAAQALAYGYTQGQQYAAQPLHGSSLQYNPDFSPPDPQRQQQFPQYASNMMYNVPSQTQQQSPYESVSQYQPRQSAAIEVLSTQFGVPQYFNPSEPTSAAGPAVPQQYASGQFQQPMSYPPQQASLARSTNPSPYQSSMADFAQPIASEVLEPQELALDSSSYDDAYNQYQNALKLTFENTRSGRLIEAGQSLLKISEWLLGHAVELGRLISIPKTPSVPAEHVKGLVRDEQELHRDRIKLWNEFNTCWLAVLQRQKENTQEMLDTGQPPRPPQSILQEDFLERMGRELVRLCDTMERHGLVDYQMGVWEEEIIHGEQAATQFPTQRRLSSSHSTPHSPDRMS
ncbi:hypothetical protein LPUS_09441 [Lasallia pustulata]|uniref:Uncharacterized protein n=1 Tax=Lasallia pustulata TaxID=136370 RepID=A0A1W5D7B3_9LECA|nr:hypothetical protein LPUS_09441 [Lasallia pustulata]